MFICTHDVLYPQSTKIDVYLHTCRSIHDDTACAGMSCAVFDGLLFLRSCGGQDLEAVSRLGGAPSISSGVLHSDSAHVNIYIYIYNLHIIYSFIYSCIYVYSTYCTYIIWYILYIYTVYICSHR